MRILFVCLGNICRSPTAEGVMRGLVGARGLEAEIAVDSAGTGSWHIGDPPDQRASAAASDRDIVIESLARQVSVVDFAECDLLVAMDRSNQAELLRLAPDADAAERIVLLREYDPTGSGTGGAELDVPDPYYGGADGFGAVLDIVERSCAALLDELVAGSGQ